MGESLFIEPMKRWLVKKVTDIQVRSQGSDVKHYGSPPRNGESNPGASSKGEIGNGYGPAEVGGSDVKNISELGLDMAQNVFGGRGARLWNEPLRDTDPTVTDANRSREHRNGYHAEEDAVDPSTVNGKQERVSPQRLEELMNKSDRQSASSKGLKEIFLKKKATDPHLKRLLQRHGAVDARELSSEMRKFLRSAAEMKDGGK